MGLRQIHRKIEKDCERPTVYVGLGWGTLG
jgi:hypothetical protein